MNSLHLVDNNKLSLDVDNENVTSSLSPKVQQMELYAFGRLKLVDVLEFGRLVKVSIKWHGILCLSSLFWLLLCKTDFIFLKLNSLFVFFPIFVSLEYSLSFVFWLFTFF